MDERRLRLVLETIIRASQGNFDHLSGEAKLFARRYNRLANDVADLYDLLGIEHTGESNEESGGSDWTTPVVDGASLTVEADDGAPTVSDVDTLQFEEDHFVVTDVGGGTVKVDHDSIASGNLHPEYLTPAEGDALFLTPVEGDAAYINEGQAAGGDLSGTYPNPSVTDDSHAHTSGTAPGAGGSSKLTWMLS